MPYRFKREPSEHDKITWNRTSMNIMSKSKNNNPYISNQHQVRYLFYFNANQIETIIDILLKRRVKWDKELKNRLNDADDAQFVASYNDGFVEKVSKYPKIDFYDGPPQKASDDLKLPRIDDEPSTVSGINLTSRVWLLGGDDSSSMNAIKFRKIIKRSRKKPTVI